MKRLQKADRDRQIGERNTVLAQPHRRSANGAALDQKLESPLGRFVLKRQLRNERYDSGIEYGILARRCLRARANGIDIVENYDGSGGEMPEATARWLQKEVSRLETPLKKADKIGFLAVQTLTIFEREISIEAEFAAARSLYKLACLLRKVGNRRNQGEIRAWQTEEANSFDV